MVQKPELCGQHGAADLKALQIIRPVCQRVTKNVGHTGTYAHKDTVPVLDQLDGLGGVGQLGLKKLF